MKPTFAERPEAHIDWNCVLETERVQLRPMALSDRDSFGEISFDPECWTYFAGVISNHDELDAFIAAGTADRAQRTRLAFTVVERPSGKVAGSTAIGNISLRDRRLEIGWTWLGAAYRGTDLNRQCKFLLLRHAFEDLEMERVEFKTDVLNQRARRALRKIGATEEGVLRSHTLMPGNRRRDTIYYSVLASEWAERRQELYQDLTVL